MENQPAKLNKITKISIIAGMIVIALSAVYCLAIFLPQRQKANIEMAKLELEAKIEQEKTEQARIEQIKADEESKRQTELLEEQKQKEEAKRKEEEGAVKKNEIARNTCLANAKSYYQKAVNNIGNSYNPDFDGMSPSGIVSSLKSATEAKNTAYTQASTNYTDLKNDCYHKYPLPNENF
ncbi:MAG: hypothetical protein V1804_00535 [Patescibacteria group bacterium]